jgi:hypothetical protein
MMWTTALVLAALPQTPAAPIALSCAYDGAEIMAFSITVDEGRQKVLQMIPGIDPIESSARITATQVLWSDASSDAEWVSEVSRVDLTLRTRVRKAGEPERWLHGRCVIPKRQF